jgi:hypothetical protein
VTRRAAARTHRGQEGEETGRAGSCWVARPESGAEGVSGS